MKIKSYKILTVKVPKTVEREMDFLYEIELEDGTSELLHLEFQTKNDNDMIYRMGFYHGLAWFKYRKPIRHAVIYLGKGKARMRTKLTEKEAFTDFDLISVNQLDTDVLLSSQVPEVILLAFLSDYPPEEREAILRLVIEGLKKHSASKSELSRYAQQLLMLSRLRNFEEQASKIIQDMPLLYDIETDYLYKQGVEQGVEQVAIRSLEEGLEYEFIKTITGLSLEQIAEIDEERKKSSTHTPPPAN